MYKYNPRCVRLSEDEFKKKKNRHAKRWRNKPSTTIVHFLVTSIYLEKRSTYLTFQGNTIGSIVPQTGVRSVILCHFISSIQVCGRNMLLPILCMRATWKLHQPGDIYKCDYYPRNVECYSPKDSNKVKLFDFRFYNILLFNQVTPWIAVGSANLRYPVDAPIGVCVNRK